MEGWLPRRSDTAPSAEPQTELLAGSKRRRAGLALGFLHQHIPAYCTDPNMLDCRCFEGCLWVKNIHYLGINAPHTPRKSTEISITCI